MYKENLVLNNLQWLICHKNQPTNQLNKQTNKQTNHFLKSGECGVPLRCHSPQFHFDLEW